ncbi:hypothetical protein KEJ25_07330 [Candidatus Bathyarchaeota archaeon]|nr:hypothetical protein [Candidatus Bathyarchaeota archaeon]
MKSESVKRLLFPLIPSRAFLALAYGTSAVLLPYLLEEFKITYVYYGASVMASRTLSLVVTMLLVIGYHRIGILYLLLGILSIG